VTVEVPLPAVGVVVAPRRADALPPQATSDTQAMIAAEANRTRAQLLKVTSRRGR
jgi:hypothetical protein